MTPQRIQRTKGAIVKEHPILFTGEMVRAILSGRKTQTRRTVKPQFVDLGGWSGVEGKGYLPVREDGELAAEPKWSVGDRLWVRETWRAPVALDKLSPKAMAEKCMDAGYRRPWCPVKYEADGTMTNPHMLSDFGGTWGKTRGSIHMPRWASRITLEVTGIRVERVNDISEADAIAEGCAGRLKAFPPFHHSDGKWPAVEEYESLWEQINGTGSWAANPWVFVLSFKIAAPYEGEAK